MKVGTPLGDYPFEFRRLERREGGLAAVGLVAGLESTVVIEPDDLRRMAKVLGPPSAILALLAYLRCARAS